MSGSYRVAPPAAPGPAAWEEIPELTESELDAIALRPGRLIRLAQGVRRDTPLLAGLGLLAGFAILGLAEWWVWGSSIGTLSVSYAALGSLHPAGPSWVHPFGVMRGIGVGVFSSILQATPWDLAILGAILGSAFFVGVLLGTYAGFHGGVTDWLITAMSDLLLAVPPFFFVIVLLLGVAPVLEDLYGPNVLLPSFVGLFAFVLWPYYARPVRARAARVSREPYVEAARASGATNARLVRRHILPNSLYPAFAQLPIDVYNVFFVLTVFPFLGCFDGGSFGTFAWISPLPPPVDRFPEWGNLLAIGACYGWSVSWSLNWWWMYIFPLATIVLFGAAVTLTCDGLERLLHGRVVGP